MEIDIDIDPEIVFVKLLLNFEKNDENFLIDLLQSDLSDIINNLQFFINSYQPLFISALSDIDYDDMFFNEDNELDQKIIELLDLFIRSYSVDLPTMLRKVILSDPHIENRRQYLEIVSDYFVNNELDDFYEHVKYPLINYLYYILSSYGRYYLSVQNMIDELSDESLREELMERLIEYDIEDYEGSDIEA